MLIDSIKRSADPLSDGYYVESRPGGLGSVLSLSSAGMPITPDIAMTISAVNNCTRLLCEGISTVPCQLMERLEKGRRKVEEDPLYEVLHFKANEEMPACELFSMAMGYTLHWGDFFAEIERTNADQIKGLWPLRPDRMKVERGRRNQVVKGLRVGKDAPGATDEERLGKWFYYELKPGEIIEFRRSQILQIPGLGYDGMRGRSVIGYARNALGLSLAMDTFAATYFRQGTSLGGWVESPDELGSEGRKNLDESIQSFHEGLPRAHRILILEQNAKYHELGLKVEDAQIILSRKFGVVECARFFNVPLFKIKSMEQATNNNVEQEQISWVMDSLRPHFVKWEQWMGLCLLGGRKNLFVRFVAQALMRGDFATRMEGYQKGRYSGWMSGNDIRQLEDMNPVDGLDTIWQPVNMTDALNPAPAAMNANLARCATRLVTACMPAITQAATRIVAREVADLGRLAEPTDEKIDAVYDEAFRDFARRALEAPGLVFALNFRDALQFPRDAKTATTQDMGDEAVTTVIQGWARAWVEARANLAAKTFKDANAQGTFDKTLEKWEDGLANRDAAEAMDQLRRFTWNAARHFYSIGEPSDNGGED
jgi:HK97 family phage portal protein